MKVTKYPQSCFVIEKDGREIIIDPGNIALGKYPLIPLVKPEAVLYTHQHVDHYDSSILNGLLERHKLIYANDDVAKLIGKAAIVVKDKVPFKVAGFTVTPYDLPHCQMLDGSDGPPNTGFLIDGSFFLPGDGVDLEGLEVENLALPIAGPSIHFAEANRLAKQLKAKRVIPIHYEIFIADPAEFKQQAKGIEVFVLKDTESVNF